MKFLYSITKLSFVVLPKNTLSGRRRLRMEMSQKMTKRSMSTLKVLGVTTKTAKIRFMS